MVDRREPELIVVRCHEGADRSLLTCAVTPTAVGCRVLVRETVEHGDWSAERGTRREECYRQSLAGRLPALLDWLAFQQVDLRRDSAAPTAVLPVALMADLGRRPTRRRTTWVVAGSGAAALTLGLAGWALLPGWAAGQTADPVPPPARSAVAPDPTRSAVTPRPTPTTTPSSARPSPAPPTPSRMPSASPSAPDPVGARYETVSTRVFGHRRGGGRQSGRDAGLGLDGGRHPAPGQLGRRGDRGRLATGRAVGHPGPAVPAGEAQAIRFDVRTADPVTKTPQGCTVDERPCAGL